MSENTSLRERHAEMLREIREHYFVVEEGQGARFTWEHAALDAAIAALSTPPAEGARPAGNAIGWINRIDRTLIAMKGRALNDKQRSAVIGTLLTLDPDSPFFVAAPDDAAMIAATEGSSNEA